MCRNNNECNDQSKDAVGVFFFFFFYVFTSVGGSIDQVTDDNEVFFLFVCFFSSPIGQYLFASLFKGLVHLNYKQLYYHSFLVVTIYADSNCQIFQNLCK